MNPYTKLLKEIRAWVQKLQSRHTIHMFHYSASKLTPSQGWRLDDVRERVRAAEALGYEVVIEANDSGLSFVYKKKMAIPSSWQ